MQRHMREFLAVLVETKVTLSDDAIKNLEVLLTERFSVVRHNMNLPVDKVYVQVLECYAAAVACISTVRRRSAQIRRPGRVHGH
jgi:hypothetical protein